MEGVDTPKFNKKEYENKLTLPSSLAINIVELCDTNKCCIKV